jgi:hypothetical protein
MNWYHREPTLDEMLSDSIIRAVMEADGVDPQELAVMLRQLGRSLLIRSPRRRAPAICLEFRGRGP